MSDPLRISFVKRSATMPVRLSKSAPRATQQQVNYKGRISATDPLDGDEYAR